MRTTAWMLALWVLPTIDTAWGRACAATLRVRNLLVVNNAEDNRGVANSWNLGAAAALALGVSYLVVCSESLRFGQAGGLDFEAALDGTAVVLSMCSGWHLVALSTDVIRKVGLFDPVFSPAYFEDADYMRRMELAGCGIEAGPNVKQVPVDVEELTIAHSLTEGLVSVDYGAQHRKFLAKWGGDPGGETFDHPYNNPGADLRCVSAS